MVFLSVHVDIVLDLVNMKQLSVLNIIKLITCI